HASTPQVPPQSGVLTVMLILTAFASGCSAMTGVEAISNGVPIFTGKDVQERSQNAARTLVVMISVLVTLFLGTTYLAWRLGAYPRVSGDPTITSQIAHAAFGGSWLFYLVQIATLLILIFAANTSFAGFPLLAAILSRDKFLPPLFAYRGERLAYSSGILILGGLSAIILVAFQGNVSNLINLYALGVFTSFTLSQFGMVRHWQHVRTAVSNRGWRIFANGLGAATTAVVTLVIVVAKFDRGAWVVLIIVPLLVGAFLWLRRYYTRDRIFVEANFPDVKASVAIVPIFNVRDARTELRYAAKIASHAIAVHIVADEAEAESFHRRWDAIMGASTTGLEPQLEIIISPYRNIVFPMARFVEWVAQEAPPEETFAILLPKSEHLAWWEQPLHRRIAQRVRAVLEREQDGHRFQVIDLPYRLAHPTNPPK
nr:APC family permease [Ktedonobacterales bacterium]